jgi:hypothetical protein
MKRFNMKISHQSTNFLSYILTMQHYSAETKLSESIRNSTLARRYHSNKKPRAPLNSF